MKRKAKRRELVENSAGALSALLPGYTITVIADNGKDRIEVTSGPPDGYVAELLGLSRAK